MPGAEPCEAHSFKRIREGNTLFIPPHPVVEVPHHGLKVDQSARGKSGTCVECKDVVFFRHKVFLPL